MHNVAKKCTSAQFIALGSVGLLRPSERLPTPGIRLHVEQYLRNLISYDQAVATIVLSTLDFHIA